MNVRSKILKIRNIPTDATKIDQINAKPYAFILACLFIGLCLMTTKLYIIGAVVTFVFLYYLLFVKDVVLIEFFDRFAVFYLNNGKDECFVLFWEDVLKWEITCCRNELDVLHVTLRNQEVIALKCLGKKKVAKYLNEYVSLQSESEITKQHAL